MTTPDKFHLYAQARVYEDASKSEGHRRRIAGIMSTDSIDRQGEAVLQRGLAFDNLIGPHGFFNENHSNRLGDILGKPTSVKHFAKGQVLPDGSTSPFNCTWVEGYLYDDLPKADAVWALANAMKGTGSGLAFSIEGQIQKREGPGGRVIGKACLNHCAITAAPVNQDSRLIPIVRSLTAIENGSDIEKGDGCIGPPSGPNGANCALTTQTNAPNIRESWIGNVDNAAQDAKRKKKKLAKKSLTYRDALECFFKAHPSASVDNACAAARLMMLYSQKDR